MNIEVKIPDEKHAPHYAQVWVNDRVVGSGPVKECEALAEELKEDEEKAKLVYNIMEDYQ